MREINRIVKGYAKMVVANVDNEDLRDEHFLLITSGTILSDSIREIKKTSNWARNLYKNFDVDTDIEEEIEDCVSNLIQNNIDLLIG